MGLGPRLLLSVIISVRLDVLLSYYGNGLFTSLQVAFQGIGADNDGDAGVRNPTGSGTALIVFAILATIYISRVMLDIYLTQRFIIPLAAWLTDRVTCDWLDDHAYYRPGSPTATSTTPDQRIQWTTSTSSPRASGRRPTPRWWNLEHAAVRRDQLVGDGRFVHGDPLEPVRPRPMFGITLATPQFWVVLIYVVFATIIAFWIGHPLIRWPSGTNSPTPCSATRWCGCATPPRRSVSTAARTPNAVCCETKFAEIIANYPPLREPDHRLTGWNLSMSQIINPPPLVIQAPRLFPARSTSATSFQSSSAFGSDPRLAVVLPQRLRLVRRLPGGDHPPNGLVETNRPPRAAHPDDRGQPRRFGGTASGSRCAPVRRPAGGSDRRPVGAGRDAGHHRAVGAGKTTLLRSLAQLLAIHLRDAALPTEDHATMFLSQMPYVPLGDLRTVVSHPANSERSATRT